MFVTSSRRARRDPRRTDRDHDEDDQDHEPDHALEARAVGAPHLASRVPPAARTSAADAGPAACCSGGRCGTAISDPHPGVEVSVQKVRHQVGTITAANSRNKPCSIGKSWPATASRRLAEPRPREHGLDRDRAAEHEAEVDRIRSRRAAARSAPRGCRRTRRAARARATFRKSSPMTSSSDERITIAYSPM